MGLRRYKAPKTGASRMQKKMMAKFAKPCVKAPGIYTPQIGLNMGMDCHGAHTPPPTGFVYHRPDGTSLYHRPDGTSLYLRP